LKKLNIDGWLLYDFKRLNPLALHFLQIDQNTHLTRRFFFWIPKEGEPLKLVSAVENPLKTLPGRTDIFNSFDEMKSKLKGLVEGKKIAMEYSPFAAVPEVSKVDAGTIELIRSFKAEVVSSGDLYQAVTCLLTPDQFESHLKAANNLDRIVADTWDYLFSRLGRVTERDVCEFILDAFKEDNMVTEGEPEVAVNANTSLPHYRSGDVLIREGDYILIDLWGKIDKPNAIMADITRVGYAGKKPPSEIQKVFDIVKKARDKAIGYVEKRYGKEPIEGRAVDRAAREVIEESGYGPFFCHRLGHNIHESTHGPGAHNDSLETDERRHHLPGYLF
ncbi:MAG: M24 family metallopeptidase, partial [Parachlamydiaceae bacterium]